MSQPIILLLKSRVGAYTRRDGTFVSAHERRQSRKQKALGRVVAAAKKARESLSSQAINAIESWQAANWHTGKLERSFAGRDGPEVASDIERAFRPVREALRAEYGDTIRLYRGQRNIEDGELDQGRVLFSWTTDEKVARDFAYNGKLYRELTDEDIQRALDQYQRAGFTKVGRATYKRDSQDPDYYLIYERGEFIADGDDLEADLRREQRHRRESNERIKARGNVMVADVPLDEIVWMTNDLGSKEFIVRRNPLEPGKAELTKSIVLFRVT